MFPAATVINQDRSRDDRCRGYGVALLDNRLDVVRRQHLYCRALCRTRERMGILSNVEGAVGPLRSTVVTNRLSYGQDVRFRESAVYW